MLRVHWILPVVLLGASTLLPPSATAQACIGSPLEQERSAVSTEVGLSRDKRLYGVGYARGLPGSVTLRVELRP